MTPAAAPAPSAPARATDPRAAQIITEMQTQQAESDRLAAEHPILTTAAMVAAGAGPGLARAALTPGLPMAARAAGTARAVAAGAAPVVKFEAVKFALVGLGVNPHIADMMAAYVSGRRGRAKSAEPAPPAATTTAAAPDVAAGMSAAGRTPAPMYVEEATPAAASPAAPVASPPAAPALSVASATPQAAPKSPPASPGPASIPLRPGETLALPPSARTPGQMSPAWVQNDLGLVVKRMRLTLSKPQYREAETLVREGRSPLEAVTELQQRHGLTPAAPATPAPAASADPSRAEGAAEATAYRALRNAGKTHPQAMKSIRQQRALMQQTGSPSPAQTDERLRQRRDTGRWPEDEQ